MFWTGCDLVHSTETAHRVVIVRRKDVSAHSTKCRLQEGLHAEEELSGPVTSVWFARCQSFIPSFKPSYIKFPC